MNWIFIITPLSGAVIGYFTNWLAVKMLFRPHTQKRLFGMRIPLTPGLIPKEKDRLAKSMGQSLAANILTEDALVSAVTKPEVMDKLVDLLDGFLSNLGTGVYDAQMDAFCEMIADKLAHALTEKSESVNAAFTDIINKIAAASIPKIAEFLQSDAFRREAEALLQKAAGVLRTNDKTLADYLPGDFVDGAKAFIPDKYPEFVEFLKALPVQFPEIDETLGRMVAKIAEENFGSLLGIFIRYDQLYEKIKVSLFDYMDDPANAKHLTQKAVTVMESILTKPLNELAGTFGLLDKLAARGVDIIQRSQIGKAGEHIGAYAAAKVSSMDLTAILIRLFPDPANLKALLLSAVKALTSALTSENAAKLRDIAVRALHLAAAKGGAHIVTSMRFDLLIEDKINSFSPQEAEATIVSVVKRELRAITYVGGVLGLIIGTIPLILQALGI